MNVAFYSAAAGMKAYQDKLDVTANNMANINTTGYKKMASSFNDLLYTDMNTKADGEHKVGHGVKTGAVDYVFQQGLLARTERVLDFAVVGKAYFAIDDGSGTTSYTRDGSFKIGMNGGTAYLTTQSGYYVLDGTGRRIEIPMKAGTNMADVDSVYERIGLYTFENPYGLQAAGGNLYKETDNSGRRTSVANSAENRLVSGALEASMADTASEMVSVIEAQRALQLNGRIVTTADQIEEIVNNLR